VRRGAMRDVFVRTYCGGWHSVVSWWLVGWVCLVNAPAYWVGLWVFVWLPVLVCAVEFHLRSKGYVPSPPRDGPDASGSDATGIGGGS
jgi:hypothetical protein